jgi:hypothetical protein
MTSTQLLINEIRALRARCYGADWATTPELDAAYNADADTSLENRVDALESDVIALNTPKVSETE